MGDYIDPDQGRKETKILKDFSKAMGDTLIGKPEECSVEGCHASQDRHGNLCEHHRLEKLTEREKALEKESKARQKAELKVLKSQKLRSAQELETKLVQYFNANRWCEFCGHYCEIGEGKAIIKDVNPQTVGWPLTNKDRYLQTVCVKCI
jgi:hypothetical protein